MKLAFTEEQEQLRQDIRAYITDLMTDELRAELNQEFKGEGGGPIWKECMRKLGKDGWIGLGWPKEYGGQGFDTFDPGDAFIGFCR